MAKNEQKVVEYNLLTCKSPLSQTMR
jgi:hypothetical protein